MQIQNGAFRITYDHGAFSLQALPSGNTFISAGKLSGTDGALRTIPVSDKVLGDGEAIEVSYSNGNRDELMLMPNLPFVLVRSKLRNGDAKVLQLQKVRPVSFAVDLGTQTAGLRVLGTDGLTAPDKNPGSYAWLAVADPQTRNGVVCAWLTHDRGSGVLFSKISAGRVQVDAQIDYGRLRIAPGNEAQTETLALGYFDDARLGMEAWAEAVAKVYAIRLRPQPVGYCTWYSSPHGGASDEKHLAEQSAFAAKSLAPYGFTVLQIDDGWQEGTSGGNGPKKVFSAHNPKGPYPSGMKAAAEDIRKHGLTPGIWFMPFAGTHNDPFFKDHQDWFVKRADGTPYDTAWGGTCLDMTQDGARGYLRSVVRQIAKDWGFSYFKMDGMWTGSATKQIYINSGCKDDGIGDAVFSNPAKTNIEAYRDGLKLVRETAGDGVFILGCCAPQNMRSYGGAFGLVDAMRVGPDNGTSWGGLQSGPLFSSRNYHLHGRIWYNDPDPLYVRAQLPLAHAQLICSWVAISGNLNLCSEWLPSLPPERLDILRRTMPSHGLLPRPVDLFEQEPARIWLLTDERRTPRRDVVALYNWTSNPLDVDCECVRLGLPRSVSYVAFDYWANAFLPPFGERLQTSLPKESCQVLALRPALGRPQLLSTSRHITQGIVDVLEEKWDDAGATLSGRSNVVAGDPYELRIIAVAPGKSWRVEAAKVSAEDEAAGVKTAYRELNGCVRVVIESPLGREVSWSVRFRVGAAEATRPSAVAQLKGTGEPLQPVVLSWEKADGVIYEISRDGGNTVRTPAASWADVGVESGQTYAYTVTAVDLAGNRSEAAKATVTTPPAPKLPPVPPQPDVHLSDLKPAKATVGYGHLGIDKSIEGNPLTIAGKKYNKGLGVHAVSELVYACKEEYKSFVAIAGLDDEKREDERPSVVCEVYADSHLLAASPKLLWRGNSFWHFDVAIPPKTKHLRLIVTDAGDGIAADHADWVDAGFITVKK